jgi:hypothetical protein
MGAWGSKPLQNDASLDMLGRETRRLWRLAKKSLLQGELILALAYLESLRRLDYHRYATPAQMMAMRRTYEIRFEREEATLWSDPNARRHEIDRVFNSLERHNRTPAR